MNGDHFWRESYSVGLYFPHVSDDAHNTAVETSRGAVHTSWKSANCKCRNWLSVYHVTHQAAYKSFVFCATKRYRVRSLLNQLQSHWCRYWFAIYHPELIQTLYNSHFICTGQDKLVSDSIYFSSMAYFCFATVFLIDLNAILYLEMRYGLLHHLAIKTSSTKRSVIKSLSQLRFAFKHGYYAQLLKFDSLKWKKLIANNCHVAGFRPFRALWSLQNLIRFCNDIVAFQLLYEYVLNQTAIPKSNFRIC